MKLTIFYKNGKMSFDHVEHLPGLNSFVDDSVDALIDIDMNKNRATIMLDDVIVVTVNYTKITME